MRAASAELTADIAEECTTLCRLWTCTRTDGTVLRFTDCDRPVTYLGDVYRADVTFTSSSILTSASVAKAQSVTIKFMMDPTAVAETDLRARRWDAAGATISIINYEAPEHGIMTMFRGTFGRIRISDKGVADVEVRPLGALNSGSIGVEVYSKTCRADLGDLRCKVGLEALKVAFTVDTVDGLSFTASEATAVDTYYAQGFVKWLTGDNATTTSLITSNDQGDTSVVLASVGKAIQVGDTGYLYPGCDKLSTTCRDKFANLVNFRGEPDVPGFDILPGIPHGQIAANL